MTNNIANELLGIANKKAVELQQQEDARRREEIGNAEKSIIETCRKEAAKGAVRATVRIPSHLRRPVTTGLVANGFSVYPSKTEQGSVVVSWSVRRRNK